MSWTVESSSGIAARSKPLASSFEWRIGDQQLAEEILEHHPVATSPAPPGPSVYGQDLALALAETMEEVFGPLVLPLTGTGVGEVVGALLLGVAVVAILTFGLLLAQALFRRWRRREPVVVRRVHGSIELEFEVDAHAWASMTAATMLEGDPREILTRLWWWMSRLLSPVVSQRALTGSELLRLSGRSDLKVLVEHFERLLYGGREVSSADVEQLAADLRSALVGS